MQQIVAAGEKQSKTRYYETHSMAFFSPPGVRERVELFAVWRYKDAA